MLHGPSKNGKTFYTMSIANMNGLAGKKTAFFSLEMSREYLKRQQGLARS